ncbi:MAG TPA: NAD(P)H-hydrate dehydratase [Tepidisphaeraceae bacterium]|nr:NAD(P)H-hydrate dehydratase [Tepidisphaeraceae bacterium]
MDCVKIKQLPALPPRPKSGHKGLFGHVLIVGGSDQMIGAPVLAGTAALRMGGGLVQIAMPRSVLATAISVTPELIGLALGPSDKPLLEAAEKADSLVIGPGLGQSPAARRRVMRLIKFDQPMVIDADALNLLAKKWPAGFKAAAVLTPHPGEMRRLIGGGSVPTDDAGRIELANSFAAKKKVVLVLKGERTVVSDGLRYFLNNTGDSSLSKGGSGDLLSGMLGCLLAQKMDRFDASCVAVHLHGRAGELAGVKLGRRSVLSRDVIEALPAAIHEISPDMPG